MTDLFSLKSPCMLRSPDGTKHIMAAYFKHPQGLLYFDLYWHHATPATHIHLIKGKILGSDPWKIAEYVIQILGCHGSDPVLAQQFSDWQMYIDNPANDYPVDGLIQAIARKMGAVT